MVTVKMPQVGQDIPSATIVEWRKREGDRVEAGEVVVVVESEKAVFEVEADGEGTLLEVLHEEGEEVQILRPLAYIGERGERPPDAGGGPPAGPPAGPPVDETPPVVAGVGDREGEGAAEPAASASPSARRAAWQLGVELAGVRGTGPGGRVVKRDVLGYAGAEPVLPFTKVRRRIAERLSRSAREIPHFYAGMDVDMTAAQQWRRGRNAGGEGHVTVTDLVIRATALALREFQRMNAHVRADGIELKRRVHIGVAVATEAGLLVPVVPDAHEKTLSELSRVSRENAEAARRGVLRAEVGASFTVTSLGMFGVREFLPIINPPECGILAVGAVERRAVPVGAGVGVREMMALVLGCDHRAVDGSYAARFLAAVKGRLEDTSTFGPVEAGL
jgi:pyruvate dehydrogenase E2 component (dihydrolipoamide acetyltransferase)